MNGWPRVARAAQPWAENWNPVGILYSRPAETITNKIPSLVGCIFEPFFKNLSCHNPCWIFHGRNMPPRRGLNFIWVVVLPRCRTYVACGLVPNCRATSNYSSRVSGIIRMTMTFLRPNLTVRFGICLSQRKHLQISYTVI